MAIGLAWKRWYIQNHGLRPFSTHNGYNFHLGSNTIEFCAIGRYKVHCYLATKSEVGFRDLHDP